MTCLQNLSIVLALMAAFAIPSAHAALAPGTVEKMKKEAPEVIQVKLIKVEKGKKAHGIGKRDVVYTAMVLKVKRSAMKLKVGQTIKIHSYVIELPPGILPQPGPMAPSMHPAGWKGTIYCQPKKGGKDLEIAVYGHSFEHAPDKKKK